MANYMGLDSHCYAVRLEDVIDDFSFKQGTDSLEVMYWRKHFPIHRWATRLFKRKGGDTSQHQFNCEYVRITLEDLEFLKDDMDWLDEYPYQKSDYDDFKFIKKAEEVLKQGERALYFTSWY